MHPTTQVSQATWNTNGTTPLPGGFGTHTANFTIPILSMETIYFVCNNHVLEGMKGQITVSTVSSSAEAVNKIGLEIFPNPSTTGDFFYIAHSQEFATGIMNVFNLDGRIVIADEVIYNSGKIKIDAGSGTYLYVIRGKDEELLATGNIIVSAQ
jgi:hypothetical protein